MVDLLKERAATLWNINAGDVQFEDGVFSSTTDSELKVSFKELAGKLDDTGGPVTSTGSVDLEAAGGAYGTHICDLEIDPETGKTDVVRYTVVQDVGRAIHPSYVEGQMQGGAVQGIGWALNEEYFMTEDGRMANSSYLDYRMPTTLDLPKIETIIVEVPNPIHPFGVRGVGEVPIAPPLGAVANAIHDAVGVRLYDAPMNPGRITQALEK
jgi:CO/xanthine dehydrogenase Mo-binding subunit